MPEIRFAKNAAELKRWNHFVLSHAGTSFFATSHWLDSYRAFGMKTHYLIAEDANQMLVGGAALAEFRMGPFMWLDILHGPVVAQGDVELINQLLDAIEVYAQTHKAMVVQISPFEPSHDHDQIAAQATTYGLSYVPDLLAEADCGIASKLAARGYGHTIVIRVFVRHATHGQIVDLAQEDLLMSFRKGTRRDIRYAMDSGVIVDKVETITGLERAYSIMRENATQQSYSIRPWETFKIAVWPAIQANDAVVLLAKYEEQPIATVVVLFGGRRGAYVMGGTRRLGLEKVYPAHYLQHVAMLETCARGYVHYDLTSIGTGGVADFKRGFRPAYYELVGTYSKVYQPHRLRLFLRIEPQLRKNRRRIARLTYFAKNVLNRKRGRVMQ